MGVLCQYIVFEYEVKTDKLIINDEIQMNATDVHNAMLVDFLLTCQRKQWSRCILKFIRELPLCEGKPRGVVFYIPSPTERLLDAIHICIFFQHLNL